MSGRPDSRPVTGGASSLSVASTMHQASGTPFDRTVTDRARVFRAAARHSRWVRFYRRAIPVSLVLVLATVAAIAYFKPLSKLANLPIDPSRLGLSGTKITMEAPRLAGFTSDARPYELTATAAAQDMTKPDVLELKGIDAKVELKDGQRVKIKAINGLYNTKSEILKLHDDIVLTTSSGYEGRLSEATVETGSGHIVSDSPLELKLLNGGKLNANRLEVVENGASIQFSGGVELFLNQETQSSDLRGTPTR